MIISKFLINIYGFRNYLLIKFILFTDIVIFLSLEIVTRENHKTGKLERIFVNGISQEELRDYLATYEEVREKIINYW